MMTPALVQGLAGEIEKRLRRSKLAIPVGVSVKHCHLTREHFKILFGRQAEPRRIKDIKQPGFYAAEECIDVKGPKGILKKIRLVAPYRDHTQIELAATDAFGIGLNPPVRESGDVKGSSGATLIGPVGQVDIKEGVIVAQRHLHFSPDEARAIGIASGEVVRVGPKYSLEFHVDTDEANAVGLKTGDVVHIA